MRIQRALLGILLTAALTLFAQDGEYASLKTKQWITAEQTQKFFVSAGKTTDLKFSFRINEGIHINSHLPSSDLLIPTTLNITAVPQIKLGKVVYPKGTDLALPFDPTEKLNIYTGSVMLNLPITVPAGTKPGAYTVHTEISYQACNDRSCFPPRKLPVDLVVNVN